MKQRIDIITHNKGTVVSLHDVTIPGLARDQSITVEGIIYRVQSITHEIMGGDTPVLYTDVYVTQV